MSVLRGSEHHLLSAGAWAAAGASRWSTAARIARELSEKRSFFVTCFGDLLVFKFVANAGHISRRSADQTEAEQEPAGGPEKADKGLPHGYLYGALGRAVRFRRPFEPRPLRTLKKSKVEGNYLLSDSGGEERGCVARDETCSHLIRGYSQAADHQAVR